LLLCSRRVETVRNASRRQTSNWKQEILVHPPGRGDGEPEQNKQLVSEYEFLQQETTMKKLAVCRLADHQAPSGSGVKVISA
jgi:hypothetical protein